MLILFNKKKKNTELLPKMQEYHTEFTKYVNQQASVLLGNKLKAPIIVDTVPTPSIEPTLTELKMNSNNDNINDESDIKESKVDDDEVILTDDTEYELETKELQHKCLKAILIDGLNEVDKVRNGDTINVLDFNSGPGLGINELYQHYNGNNDIKINVDSIECNNHWVNYIQNKYDNKVNIHSIDINKTDELMSIDKKYDIIMMRYMLHNVREYQPILDTVLKHLLNKNGFLIINDMLYNFGLNGEYPILLTKYNIKLKYPNMYEFIKNFKINCQHISKDIPSEIPGLIDNINADNNEYKLNIIKLDDINLNGTKGSLPYDINVRMFKDVINDAKKRNNITNEMSVNILKEFDLFQTDKESKIHGGICVGFVIHKN